MAVYVYDLSILRSCFGDVKQRFAKIDIECISPAKQESCCNHASSCNTNGIEKSLEELTVSNVNVPSDSPRFVIRPLSSTDFTNGVTKVLAQLTAVGNVNESLFLEAFESMRNSQSHFVTVIEEVSSKRVIAHGTLYVHELFRGVGFAHEELWGRVEDIVVLEEFRGHQFGSIMVQTLNALGKLLGCKCISLECKHSNRPFYEKLGYRVSIAEEQEDDSIDSQKQIGDTEAKLDDDSKRNLFLVRRFDR